MTYCLRGRVRAVVLITIAFTLTTVTAFGASSYVPAKRVDNSLVQKAVHYSMPYPDESIIDNSPSGKAVTNSMCV